MLPGWVLLHTICIIQFCRYPFHPASFQGGRSHERCRDGKEDGILRLRKADKSLKDRQGAYWGNHAGLLPAEWHLVRKPRAGNIYHDLASLIICTYIGLITDILTRLCSWTILWSSPEKKGENRPAAGRAN